MKKLISIIVLGASLLAGATSAHAIVDDGSGCGCIRPCHIVIR